METIGERLKRRREELGLSIEQAAEATKFRPELIESVEEGRAGVFSAGVYRDGFIRTYAGLLNLDGDLLLRDQKTEEERAHEAIRGLKVRPPRSAVSPRVLAGVVAVVVVGIVAAVLIGRAGRGDDATRRQDGVPEGSSEVDSKAGSRDRARRMRHVAAAKAPDSVASTPASVSAASDTAKTPPAVAARTPASERGESEQTGTERGESEPAVAERGQPERMVPGPGGSDLTVPGRTAPAGRVEPQSTERAPAVPAASPVQTGGGMHTLEIVATRSANLTIKSGERMILSDYWLKRGERVTRTDTGPFSIVTLSDRQGVSITLDGKPVRLPLSDSPELFDWPIPSDR